MKIDKKISRSFFDGSNDLFNSCWRQYCNAYSAGGIDEPTCQEDVNNLLDSIASEKVNNPKSEFYIYG